MNDLKETKVLVAIRRANPKKKRVNFFISEAAKTGLSRWCKKNGVSESAAIEMMIRETVPNLFLKDAEGASRRKQV